LCVHMQRGMGVLHDASCEGDVSQIRLALQAGVGVDSKEGRCATAHWVGLACADMLMLCTHCWRPGRM
jgi:hypothetical protein